MWAEEEGNVRVQVDRAAGEGWEEIAIGRGREP
jgi:hypothetical protein